jgi:hypothetical protein
MTFLEDHALTVEDIGLLITGKNGDIKNDAPYEQLKAGVFNRTPSVNYKHLSGEYSTSSAFALWVAANIISQKTVPPVLQEQAAIINAPGKILIYNHYQNKYHSLMLVSAC